MKKFITKQQIEQEVRNMAFVLENNPDSPDVILCTLSGAVLFFSDLIKKMERTDFVIDFIKCKSYVSNGEQVECVVTGPFGNTPLTGKNVLIVEDLIDTGKTVEAIYKHLLPHNCKSITFATLLQRSGFEHDPQYKIIKAFTVMPQDWLVGYGLDDNDKKRNLPDIYLC